MIKTIKENKLSIYHGFSQSDANLINTMISNGWKVSEIIPIENGEIMITTIYTVFLSEDNNGVHPFREEMVLMCPID